VDGKRAIAASWIVTGDPALAPIERGAVVLDPDERVLAVGTSDELAKTHRDARWEAHRAVLMPGLVNAHVHLELSGLRGQVAGGRGFTPWVSGLMQARERMPPEQDIDALDRGLSELLGSGTVAIGEVTNSLAAVPYLGSAPLAVRVFHEVFGSRGESARAMLKAARAQRTAIPNWPANVSYALAPHTLYTLHPEVLRELLAETRASGALTSLHLCEHPAERKLLADGGGPFTELIAQRSGIVRDWPAPGSDPVRYAQALGALAPDVLCVHLTDAQPDELQLVAEARAPVVLCPRSNLHIEVKLPPLVEMLRVGLTPALGTDSLASCPTLDVLDDARALFERFSSVPARTLLAMVTSYGARALGFEARLGRIAQGLLPGILAFPHGAIVPADPERFLLARSTRERTVLSRPAPPALTSEET
jgi:cytosine/adenosine deaminase-related metal-dependent hydrolase